ncbi:putative ferredoxin--NADP(+) reductase [Dioscorea sansibarensis]
MSLINILCIIHDIHVYVVVYIYIYIYACQAKVLVMFIDCRADLCSVMNAMILPGKGLEFNHSASRIFSNLSFRNNAAPCLSLRNDQKQHSKYNYHKVLCMSARRTTRLNAAVIPLEAGETRELTSKTDTTNNTTVVSVETLVGPKGGIGEVCNIVLNHGGSFSFKEGQYLQVHFQEIERYFSIASCSKGDSFDGKTLTLCVRRAELTANGVSNYLCNVKAGETVEISGPKGGKMVPPDNPKAKLIMVATETGKFQGDVWLFSGAKNYNSLLYEKEFIQILNGSITQFRYQRALNDSVSDSIYQSGNEIFTLLNEGAYIFFAGSKTMMPGIREVFQQIAQERGVIWADMYDWLNTSGQWRVEVY